MEKLNPDQISAVVDEVVRRVISRLEGTPPSAQAACACTNPGCSGKPECTCAACKTERTAANKEMLEKGACRIGCTNAAAIRCEDLAQYIDHTMLKANTTDKEIEKLCLEARQHHFASVCVNTSHVESCARLLAGSGVKVCAVVGFPLGGMSTDAKAFESRDAVMHGADEIDMVINVGKLQSGDLAYVSDDIKAVVRAAGGQTVKVILEMALLTEEQKVAGCVLAKAAGAHFVKTSTGFGPGGATAEDVALMRRIVGNQMGVKAAGGIRDCATAQKMVESGATRIGASAGVSIIQGKDSKSTY